MENDIKGKECEKCCENKECQECCGKWGHKSCCAMHKHFWLRWLLGIAILLITFWLGVKVGEFKAYFGSYGYSRGYGMMRYGNFASPLDDNQNIQYRSMMNWQQQPQSTATGTSDKSK